MGITQVTRKALLAEFRNGPIWWWGDLGESAFIARLFSLGDYPSDDPRYGSAEGDFIQHRINNAMDWDDFWIFEDRRFGLGTDDDQLLRFLAETLHPEVRTDSVDAERIAEIFNAHLRRDGVELFQRSFISQRPVYGWRHCKAPVATATKLRDAIAEVIWDRLSAGRVADFCETIGLGAPFDAYDDPMSGKKSYVLRHSRGRASTPWCRSPERSSTSTTTPRSVSLCNPSSPPRAASPAR